MPKLCFTLQYTYMHGARKREKERERESERERERERERESEREQERERERKEKERERERKREREYHATYVYFIVRSASPGFSDGALLPLRLCDVAAVFASDGVNDFIRKRQL